MVSKKLKLGTLMIVLALISSCSQKKMSCSGKCKENEISVENKVDKSQNMSIDNNLNLSTDNNDNQLVCKMVGAEKAEKKELLKTEIFSQVTKVEEVNNGYILNFEDKDDILLKLTDYLMIEKECCPFFIFDLNIKPNSNGISLKISGQDGAKEMLKPLIDNIKK